MISSMQKGNSKPLTQEEFEKVLDINEKVELYLQKSFKYLDSVLNVYSKEH